MAELVDAQDLGSCATGVGVRVPFPAPFMQDVYAYHYFPILLLSNKILLSAEARLSFPV